MRMKVVSLHKVERVWRLVLRRDDYDKDIVLQRTEP